MQHPTSWGPFERVRATWRYLRHHEPTIVLPPRVPHKPVQTRLRDRDFRDQEFLGCQWARAYVERCDFRDASLTDIDLRSAVLYKCDFRGARLTAVDLSGADLEGCNLRDVDLAGCNLAGADLRRTVGLTPEQLRGARTDATTQLPAGLAPAPVLGR